MPDMEGKFYELYKRLAEEIPKDWKKTTTACFVNPPHVDIGAFQVVHEVYTDGKGFMVLRCCYGGLNQLNVGMYRDEEEFKERLPGVWKDYRPKVAEEGKKGQVLAASGGGMMPCCASRPKVT